MRTVFNRASIPALPKDRVRLYTGNIERAMMSEFISLVGIHFQRSENGLMQVILLNVLSFLALLLLKIVLVIVGYEAAYTVLFRSLALPAEWSTFLRQPWALLTHFGMHISFFPTLWGILLLYTLGQVVVNRLGNRHFLAIYFLGGLAGGALFLLLYNVAPHFQDTDACLWGFAGSLYAVIVAAATLTPQPSFSLFLLALIKFKYIAGFLVLVALVNLVGAESAMSIAHLGGALLGYVYVKWHQSSAGWCQYWARFRRPGLRVIYRSTMSESKKEPEISVDHASLNHILDKVAISGYESLTPFEKQQLFNAGK